MTKDKSVAELRNLIGQFCKKTKRSWPMKKSLFIWDTCVAEPTPTPREYSPSLPLTSLFTRSPLKADGADCFYHADILSFQLPAEWRLTHAGCVALTKALAAKERASDTKATRQRSFLFLFLETICVNEKAWPEVSLPFPQSQLCTGFWPHCPKGHRQHCGGWLHSSPGSLSPVKEERWKSRWRYHRTSCVLITAGRKNIYWDIYGGGGG